jgi:DNA-binding Lrp family transcriptional regulator
MRILGRLLNNCRESDRQIGKNVGISGNAVKSRIKKMIDTKVIENFTIKIEPPVLGYELFYIVVTGQDIENILKQIKLVGDPFLVVPCVGGTTVCGIVVRDQVEEKIEIVKKILSDARVLSIFKAENSDINSKLTKTDLEIIKELMNNPREKIENLSKIVKYSTKTITRAIEKFQKDESIQFTAIYNPRKIDGFIPHAILTWTKGNIKSLFNTLEKKYGEYFLQIPFIADNQIVLFLYSDNIFKLDELTQQVRNTEGVINADLFIPKKITFPQTWITKIIKKSQKSSKLHLVYQTH